MNVGTLLTRAAARRPEAVAVAAPGRDGWRTLSFAALDRWTDRLAAGFTAHGIGRGERTLLLVTPGIDLIGVTYALFKAGAVPVLIDPGMGRGPFLRCVETLAPTAFVGVARGHLARLLFPAAFRSVRRHVTVGTRWLWGGPTLDSLAATTAPFTAAEVTPEEEAAVLFTSGSTGPAKGVVYTHGVFAAQVEALRAIYGFRPGEVDLAAFPLFSLFDNALEMTSVIPELDPARPAGCDPAKIAAALEDWHCTTAFGSPAIWTRVAPWAQAQARTFPGLERVLIAGAPVPPGLIQALRGLLPDGDVGTPYGATESLPVATITGREVVEETAAKTAAGAGTCVGSPIPGTEVAILRVTDTPLPAWDPALVLPPGEIGEIVARGPVVTRAYANLPEATAAAKIPDGPTTWHRMGDLGYLDERGRLWFCGRKSERVTTAAGPLYTDPVEGRLLPGLGGRRCALVGVGPAGAQEPVIVVEGAPDPELERGVLATGLVHRVRFHPHFPVDARHNAKIHRLALAKWAEAA